MKITLLIFFCIVFTIANGQTSASRLYNPGANAENDIAKALSKAKAEKKNVLIQTGGNWCGWCIEFNKFSHDDAQIDSIITADYVVYHLNYSPENKNQKVLARYKYPQRFGFPVFLVLDDKGSLLHTQNSVYLEQGKSYNKSKVMEFLTHWNRAALSPATYKNF